MHFHGMGESANVSTGIISDRPVDSPLPPCTRSCIVLPLTEKSLTIVFQCV